MVVVLLPVSACSTWRHVGADSTAHGKHPLITGFVFNIMPM